MTRRPPVRTDTIILPKLNVTTEAIAYYGVE